MLLEYTVQLSYFPDFSRTKQAIFMKMKMEVILFRMITNAAAQVRFVPVTQKDLGNFQLANINKNTKMIEFQKLDVSPGRSQTWQFCPIYIPDEELF